MYCIFQSCIKFAILISLSNSDVSAEKKKVIEGRKEEETLFGNRRIATKGHQSHPCSP